MLQFEATLDDVGCWWHEMVGRLRHKDQRIEIVRPQQISVKKVLQSTDRKVRGTGPFSNNSVSVITHHFCQLARSRLGKIKLLHLV